MLKSFAGFTEATQMHRSCLYAIAGKGHFDEWQAFKVFDSPVRLDASTIGYAFAQADSDNDGRISLEAISRMCGFSLAGPAACQSGQQLVVLEPHGGDLGVRALCLFTGGHGSIPESSRSGAPTGGFEMV